MINDLLAFKTSKWVRRTTLGVTALATYIVIAKSVDAGFDMLTILDITARAAVAVCGVYVCAFMADRRVRRFQDQTTNLFKGVGLKVD